MPDTTPAAIRLAEIATPLVQANPLPNEVAQRKEQVRHNARALDDAGVRATVEHLEPKGLKLIREVLTALNGTGER